MIKHDIKIFGLVLILIGNLFSITRIASNLRSFKQREINAKQQ